LQIGQSVSAQDVVNQYGTLPHGVGDNSPKADTSNAASNSQIAPPPNAPHVVVTQTSDTLVSVTDMRLYTDSYLGFSFWYPGNWSVQTVQPSEYQVAYAGGTVVNELSVQSSVNTQNTILIDEVTSPSMSITDETGVGACPVCVAMRYYFDTKAHAWKLQYPNGSSKGDPAGTTVAADTTQSTMGGLHIFPGSRRFGANKIIPLSAHNFLVVSVSGAMATGMDPAVAHALTKTIIAADPAAATPLRASDQITTIDIEKSAYTGQ
jgi:hypothetical protein